ncbi:hypothetical protein [Pseudomonas denitrificans (nom. rej.)]|uniref:Type II toxin-antitoxin system HicB family antitoxin n=1 Tax=Pseudomonas denitrificans TaxID=43306 RepID=A0A9X7N424_PSEDE|nr:hypothetical protein [Pseudomonas denitrificans (nom. rej.)]QEY74792.1 hypothetical protein F1C79_25995 [Pseudomonas denitrificans (nom. rej.)]
MEGMTYKGFTVRIAVDERDDLFVGRILGLQQIVSFEAKRLEELMPAFQSAIDDYLSDFEACRGLPIP